MAKSRLTNAPYDKQFYVCNGAQLSNLNDLAGELSTMSDADFAHHINKEKNDFAVWVGDALEEKTLSTALKRVKTRKGILKKVNDRVK